jgi:hypothetical protein
MILDAQLVFDDTVLLTATRNSTNIIDLSPLYGSNVNRELGVGEEMYVVVLVPVALTSAGATTLQITLVSDSAATLVATPVVLYTGPVIPKATLVAGYRALCVKLPAGQPASTLYQRFLGLIYTVTTGPFTGGSVYAFMVKDIQADAYYADAITIS